MGFEFGYSLDYPDALVLWEAQFGDFANGAQVIIDQFIVAAEQKWRRLSGLMLLLPHGYEGAGPEHSSARLERFLDMSAEDNIQVCYPTTAAQLFHLLRRQALLPWRKPLVVMTPKSLLRREEASSLLQAFTSGGWQRVLPDPVDPDPDAVSRLLLCSGKVAFDLMAHRALASDASVAIGRIEQLYPVAAGRTRSAGRSATQTCASSCGYRRSRATWAPGASCARTWRSWRPPPGNRWACATSAGWKAPSPATGFLKTHELEQHQLVQEAFARGTSNGR